MRYLCVLLSCSSVRSLPVTADGVIDDELAAVLDDLDGLGSSVPAGSKPAEAELHKREHFRAELQERRLREWEAFCGFVGGEFE